MNKIENKGANVIRTKIYIYVPYIIYYTEFCFFHLCSYIKNLENYLGRAVDIIFLLKIFLLSSVLVLFIINMSAI